MNCFFCLGNNEEYIPAVVIAPQITGGLVDYKPVCETHLSGWWDGSNVPVAERPPMLPIFNPQEIAGILREVGEYGGFSNSEYAPIIWGFAEACETVE